jgi:anti-anti-sigma factor
MPQEPLIEVRPHDQVLLIEIKRRTLDDSSARELADEVLTEAAAKPRVPVVLDMTHLGFAPSAAIGSLVRLSRSFKLDGRRLALVGLHPRVLGAIKVTRLDAVLEIHGTLDQFARSKPA